MITKSAAHRCGFSLSPARISGTAADNEKIMVNQVVQWSFIEIDAARFYRVRAVVSDHRSLELLSAYFGLEVVGILTLSVFSDYAVTLDYSEKSLVLTQDPLPPPDDQTVFGYEAQSGLPTIHVSIGDKCHEVLVDTGSFRTLGFPNAENFHLRSGLVEGSRGDHSYGRLADSFHLGKYSIENLEIVIGRGSPVLGMGILRYFSLTFDLPRKRVQFLRRETEPIIIPGSREMGIILAAEDGRWFVKEPLEINQAAKGDLVTAVDHAPVRGWTAEEWMQLLPTHDVLRFTVLRGIKTIEFDVPVQNIVPNSPLK
jgi:hypothetical protein